MSKRAKTAWWALRNPDGSVRAYKKRTPVETVEDALVVLAPDSMRKGCYIDGMTEKERAAIHRREREEYWGTDEQ